MNRISMLFGFVLLLAAPCACKSRPAGPAADAERADEKQGKIEDTALEAEIPADQAPEESKQRCLMEFLYVEAKRRNLERALEPVYIEARWQGKLMNIIDLVTERAAEGRYAGVESEVKDLVGDVVSEQDVIDITDILKSRLTAYGSCMAVASADESPCKAIKSVWEEEGMNCYIVYGVYGLMVREVLLGEKTCKETLAGFKQFKKEDNLAVCEALRQQKPELCPWEELSRENALCQVAASRSRLSVCNKGKFESPDRDLFCCELFGWRLSSAVSESADPYVIPEAGALSGDKQGCMRALTWGLLGDMAPIFGYNPEETEKSDQAAERAKSDLCTLEIKWSALEVP